VLTVKDAALLMGVAPKTIRRWIKAKFLKARTIARITRIRAVDLERLFDET
jgi:excisionase family DNA binding protein